MGTTCSNNKDESAAASPAPAPEAAAAAPATEAAAPATEAAAAAPATEAAVAAPVTEAAATPAPAAGSTELYILAVSANSHGTLSLAQQHNVELVIKPLDAMKGETRTPEFLAINPFHCCPCLVEGDFSVWESNTVMRYIASKNNIESAYPSDPKQRSKIDQMLDYRQSSFYPKLSAYVYPPLGFSEGEVTEEIKQAYLDAVTELVEHYLKDPTKFMGGFDEPTLVDYAMVPSFKLVQVHGHTDCEAIAAYRALFSKHVPCYAEVSKPLDGYLTYLAEQKK